MNPAPCRKNGRPVAVRPVDALEGGRFAHLVAEDERDHRRLI